MAFAQYLNFIKKIHFEGEYIPNLYFMNNAPKYTKKVFINLYVAIFKEARYQKTNMSLSKKSDIIVNTPDFFRRLPYSILLHYKLGSSKQSCRHR